MEEERAFRKLSPQPQYPHLPFIAYIDTLESLIGSVNFQKMKAEKPELYEEFVKLPSFQGKISFRMENLEQHIKECKEIVASSIIES